MLTGLHWYAVNIAILLWETSLENNIDEFMKECWERYQATNDIQYVADLMGWKSLKVAQVYTAYLGQQTKKAGIKKLHNFLHVA